MIAHTADDSLTIYTGLYGDRHGQPRVEHLQRLQPGRHDRPGRRRSRTGHRRSSTPRPPRPAEPGRHRPVHDLLRHRAGQRDARPASPGAVGSVHARRLLGRRLLDGEHGARERGRRRSRPCSAPNSPEAMETAADPDKFKDVEVAKYVGEAIHCAQGARGLRGLVARRGRHAADRAGRLPRLPGAVRREVHRARDRRWREHVAQRLPGHRREREPRRPQRGHPSGAVHAHARLPRLQPDRVAEPRRAG